MESNQNSSQPVKSDPLGQLPANYQKFVLSYVDHGNGARAAREACFAIDSAHVEASRLLKRPEIKAALDHVMEAFAMSAGEAIGRLSNWARGSLHHFLTPTGDIDLQSDDAQEHLGLIKKYKRRRTISRGENFETETITEEIELYDAKDATDKMIQLYGRYKQVPGDVGGPKQRLVINLGDGVKLCLNG